MTEPKDPRSRAYSAAGALFFDSQGHIMLVKPIYKQSWEIPGGYLQPGESPLNACIREVREELGIEPTIGHLLAVDWAPNAKEGDKILWVFDGGTLSDDLVSNIHLQESELSEYKYYSLQEAQDLLIPRLARRVAIAAEAHHQNQVVYLEGGVRPLRGGPAVL
ncbi:MAG: NUDIX domain-containing protein [Candidatus Dormibacteraceae bacterium]